MTKLACAWMVGFSLVAAAACSDDDGSDIAPNPPPGSAGTGGGGSGGTGGVADAGPGGGGSGGRAGSAGTAGTGGSPGCTPAGIPDAGLDAGSDAGALDAGADASSDASASPGVVSFAADIHPIFEASCGPCHVTDGSGGHNVGGELATAYADAVRAGQTLILRVDGGGMPPPYAPEPNNCGDEGGDQPGDPGCLSVAQVALIQNWIDQCFPQ